MAMKIVFRCCYILVFIGIFSSAFYGQNLKTGMTLSAEEFCKLRVAIETSDEENFNAIVQKFPNAWGVPHTLEQGREYLEFVDSHYLLDFSDIGSMTDLQITAAYVNSEYESNSLNVRYNFDGFSVSVYAEQNETWPYERGEAVFSLQTSEGEDISFYRRPNRDAEYLARVTNEKVGLSVEISIYDEAVDVETVISLLRKDAISYCSVRALTSDYEDDLSGIVFVDNPDKSEFSVLWIALPVGAVVIAGGAAFALLRKKRRTEN